MEDLRLNYRQATAQATGPHNCAMRQPGRSPGSPRLRDGCVYPVARAGAGLRPSCSSIESLSNIKLNETCLPSRNRST